MLTIRSLGHACHTLSDGSHSIILDPFLTGNPDAARGPGEVDVEAVLPSHGHADHFGDTLAIAKRLGCPVVACAELAGYCARQGCATVGMHIGGQRQFDFGTVKLTQAWHGSAMTVEGRTEYVGPAVGFLVTMGGVTVYFAGDTGLFGDMRLIGDEGVDVAILPIGDNYTMGPADALRAVDFLRPGMVIPMHYHAFEAIRQDAGAFAAAVEKHGAKCAVLAPGEETTA